MIIIIAICAMLLFAAANGWLEAERRAERYASALKHIAGGRGAAAEKAKEALHG